MQEQRRSLESLPPEILHQIHFYVQNPNLALVSKTLNAYLSPPFTTSYYTATYLLKLYSSSGHAVALSRALTHPVCAVKVAGDIKRIWDKRRGYVEPPHPPLPVAEPPSTEGPGDDTAETTHVVPIPRRPIPTPTRPGLSITDLPRRLFRNLSSTTPIPPLLVYLFDTYSPSPNSHNGYPLSRAVLAKNVEVIKYLLSKGADPGMRDGLAIEIAVKLGDLAIVKMLVENQALGPVSTEGLDGVASGGSGTGPGSRFGTEIPSRWVETAVKSGSDEIVSYFVHEKGVMPPLHSIMQLGKSDRKRKLIDMSREEGGKKSKSTSKSHVGSRSDSNHDMKRITKKKSKSGMKG